MLNSSTNTEEKEYPKYVSQELKFTHVIPEEYVYPVEDVHSLKCILDSRYWLKTNKPFNCCVLLLTTFDNRKIKLSVFKHRSTRNYNPTEMVKENFCVKDNLNINDVIYISCSKSTKSDNIYLREVRFSEF